VFSYYRMCSLTVTDKDTFIRHIQGHRGGHIQGHRGGHIQGHRGGHIVKSIADLLQTHACARAHTHAHTHGSGKFVRRRRLMGRWGCDG